MTGRQCYPVRSPVALCKALESAVPPKKQDVDVRGNSPSGPTISVSTANTPLDGTPFVMWVW